MLKIFIIDNWGQSGRKHHEVMRKQTPNQSGRWKGITTCDTFNEADLYIVFWLGTPHLLEKCPPKSVINFIRENRAHMPTPEAVAKNPRTIASQWVHEKPNPQVWWINKSYSELAGKPFPEKTKLLSAVISSKVDGLRAFRVEFIKRFVKAYPNVLELYGRGWERQGVKEWKGRLRGRGQKWVGLAPYRYTFAFSNGYEPNYWDEKLNDAILSGCMPIYFGCTNLSDYLPKNSFFPIDIRNPDSIHRAMEIIRSDYREQHLNELMEAKDLILNKYQFWPTLHRLITNLCKSGKMKRSICEKMGGI